MLGRLPVGLTSGPLHCASFLRQYAYGIGPIAAPHLAPNPMATYSAQSKFCRPEEDPFLLLDRASRSIEQLLRRDLPLRRTWSEQPYGEEEITLLEEEVLAARFASRHEPSRNARAGASGWSRQTAALLPAGKRAEGV